VTCAKVDQPASDDFSKATEGPGDEIGTIRFDGEAGRQGLTTTRYKGVWERDDDLANVLAAGHEPESCVNSACRECAEGQRRELAGFDEFSELSEHLSREFFVAMEDRVHRHNVKRGIPP